MSSDDAIVETIKLSGFDPSGEPEIRRFASGQLRVVFNFMPPSTTEATDGGLEPYRDFDQEMAHAIGVPVLWEDGRSSSSSLLARTPSTESVVS